MSTDINNDKLIVKLKEELSNYKKEADTIMSAALLMNSTLDLKELLRIILEQTAVLANAEASSLALVDETGKNLIFEVSVGATSDVVERITIPYGEGIIGWVIEKDEEVLINDCKNDSRFFKGVDTETKFETRSIVAVPLKTKHGIIGGVEVLNKKNNKEFNNNDLRMLKAISAQAALAIENARLYESMLFERNKIISIVNSIGDSLIVTDKYHEISMMNSTAKSIWNQEDFESIVKLETILNEIKDFSGESNFDLVMMKPENIILSNNVTELLDQFGKFAGHVISSRNITGSKFKENAQLEFVNLLGNQIIFQMKNIFKYTEFEESARIKLYEIYNMVSKFVYFTDIVSGPLRLNRFRNPLKSIIENAISKIQQKSKLKDAFIDFKIDNPTLEIDVDEDRLEECIIIILENSIKYLTNCGVISIKISVDIDGGYIKINIEDNGIGMTEEEIDFILDKKRIIERLSESKNFSMSLLYVKHIAEAHGGNVEIVSSVGVGTKITLTLSAVLL